MLLVLLLLLHCGLVRCMLLLSLPVRLLDAKKYPKHPTKYPDKTINSGQYGHGRATSDENVRAEYDIYVKFDGIISFETSFFALLDDVHNTVPYHIPARPFKTEIRITTLFHYCSSSCGSLTEASLRLHFSKKAGSCFLQSLLICNILHWTQGIAHGKNLQQKHSPNTTRQKDGH